VHGSEAWAAKLKTGERHLGAIQEEQWAQQPENQAGARGKMKNLHGNQGTMLNQASAREKMKNLHGNEGTMLCR
jgi:hypothetical protein